MNLPEYQQSYSPDTTISFYIASGRYGFLSNLWVCDVIFEGKIYKSAEHAYQAGKSSKDEINDYITIAPYPRIAALVGHNLSIYDIRPDWSRIKIGRMKSVVEAKFFQNEGLADMLLDTQDALLQEDSTDSFWGIGKKGTGRNELGKILMDVRAHMKTTKTMKTDMDNRRKEEARQRNGRMI